MAINQAKLKHVVPGRTLFVAICNRGKGNIRKVVVKTELEYVDIGNRKKDRNVPTSNGMMEYECIYSGKTKVRMEQLFLRDMGIIEPNDDHRTFLTRREAEAYIKQYHKKWRKSDDAERRHIRKVLDTII